LKWIFYLGHSKYFAWWWWWCRSRPNNAVIVKQCPFLTIKLASVQHTLTP